MASRRPIRRQAADAFVEDETEADEGGSDRAGRGTVVQPPRHRRLRPSWIDGPARLTRCPRRTAWCEPDNPSLSRFGPETLCVLSQAFRDAVRGGKLSVVKEMLADVPRPHQGTRATHNTRRAQVGRQQACSGPFG